MRTMLMAGLVFGALAAGAIGETTMADLEARVAKLEERVAALERVRPASTPPPAAGQVAPASETKAPPVVKPSGAEVLAAAEANLAALEIQAKDLRGRVYEARKKVSALNRATVDVPETRGVPVIGKKVIRGEFRNQEKKDAAIKKTQDELAPLAAELQVVEAERNKAATAVKAMKESGEGTR